MDYGSVCKYINARFGKCYNVVSYYNNIGKWLTWYKGDVKDFHVVKSSNGLTVSTRDMYRLRMGKRVCEDWASSLLNEDLSITINDASNKSSVFVQGSLGNGGVLGSNNFLETLSLTLEQMFALGTSAIVLDLDNITTDVEGNIVGTSKDSRISIKSYNATRIIPISYSNGVVTEVSFISEMTINNKTYYTLTSHIKEEDGYVIYNEILDSGYKTARLEVNTLPVIRTGSRNPLFFILRTNIANNFDLECPLGVSIFGNAIDTLKGVDHAYDKCVMEVIDGQRIIMMNKNLLTTDDYGNPIAPQDARQHYMQFFGDDANSSIESFIKEFSPSLRTESLDKELQNQLNILSNQCGLGTKYYNFSISGGVTATEYTGERNDFVRNVEKMSKGIAKSIKGVVREILWIGANILGLQVNQDAEVSISISDGVVEDDSKLKEQDRIDVREGLMTKVEYRMKWYHETESEAISKLSSININV